MHITGNTSIVHDLGFFPPLDWIGSPTKIELITDDGPNIEIHHIPELRPHFSGPFLNIAVDYLKVVPQTIAICIYLVPVFCGWVTDDPLSTA